MRGARTLGIASLVAVLLFPAGWALAAPAGGIASVSDTTPEPGQAVTVQASGLAPGGTANVDYLPDAVRLTTVTIGADGGFSVTVTIPSNTKDGPKQIVVTAIGADGRYAYLPTDLTVTGPPATADLGDTSLVPSQLLRVTGSRFLAGATVTIGLFPEAVVLGQPTADGSGRVSADVRIPSDVRNGRHGIAVSGLTAGGGYAYLKFFATVTGGSSSLAPGSDPFAGSSDLAPSSSTSSSTSTTVATTTTTRTRPRPPGPEVSASNTPFLILLVACALVLLVLLVAWLRTSNGRRWLRRHGPRRWRRRHSRR